MIGIEGGTTGAVAMVGIVLVQAIILYVAYGWLETIARKVFESYAKGN